MFVQGFHALDCVPSTRRRRCSTGVVDVRSSFGALLRINSLR